MNCPRCQTPVGPLKDPDGIITCPGCGSRLMTRTAALRSQGGPRPPSPADQPPSATLRATRATLLGTRISAPQAERAEEAASTPAAQPSGKAGTSAAGPDEILGTILQELRAVRETQQTILGALEALWRVAAPPHAAAEAPWPGSGQDGPALSPIRAPQRKTVVLLDDDPQTREAALAELRHADVPVRAFARGRAALAAIAEEKPDVIVLEIGVGGDMAGKDLVNMIKATMEWVDIPIVLWTRETVASQKEARQVHGADEVVPKSAGAAALAARVITVFRRG